jgi:hypothetical protein
MAKVVNKGLNVKQEQLSLCYRPETDDDQDVSVYGLLAITTPSGRHGLIFKHPVVAHTPR